MRKTPKKDIEFVKNNAPVLTAAQALKNNLLYTMFKSVSESDMEEIVTNQVAKAKDGDHRAAKLIIDMVSSQQPAQTPTQNVYMQQAVVNQVENNEFLSDRRRNIIAMICANGPQEIVKIANQLHIPSLDVIEAIDHHWFERDGGKINVTNEARLQIAESK